MSRPETLERWKPIIDGYQKDKESVLNYCKRLGINPRLYHHYKKEIYGRTKPYQTRQIKLLPVIAESSPEQTKVSVNQIQISYGDITDQELSRIFRLCRDL